jgi:thiosulfate/3-mercaptopyruvate sulfurtransferase
MVVISNHGTQNVWVLDGGLPAWAKANLPVKKLKMKFTKAVILNQILTQNGEIYRRYPKKYRYKEALLIDARSKDRFFGETAEPSWTS